MQLSPDDFPARSAHQDYISRDQITSARTIGLIASWLCLQVGAERFSATEWDVRDTGHHHEWLDGVVNTTPR